MIFVNDHPPAHVPVRHAGRVARIRLNPVELMHNIGYNSRELGKILELVEAHQAELLDAWRMIQGGR